MANIAIIDDDIAMDLLAQSLRYRGHEVSHYASFEEAADSLNDILHGGLIILDIIMPWPESWPHSELAGTATAGMELLRMIRKQNPSIQVIVYSAVQNSAIEDALNDDPKVLFISKWSSPSLKELVRMIHSALNIPLVEPPPRPFIVHGRNDKVKLELKNYLQNTLHLPEPIILHEQPNAGRTIIEKFEDFSAESSIAFILLTPDDCGALEAETDDMKRRARQNVIFEMGYFHGYYGRQSGRVILLHHGPLELPSDLAGLVYIDISSGIESAGELIRKEIKHVVKSNQ
jgi:predicted nucleotide-binding protein